MIGIFGDSFSDEIDTSIGGYLGGWPSALGKLYDEEIENFSESSTSISYSYQKFCEQDLSKYSKVVFVVTYPTRQLLINNAENITAFYPDTWNFVKRAVKGDVLHSHKNALVLDVELLGTITTLGLNTPMAPWFTTPKGEEWHTKYIETAELGRVCHFSTQQNIELAVLIKDYFDNGIDIHNEIKWHTDKYFTIPESMEDAGLKLRR